MFTERGLTMQPKALTRIRAYVLHRVGLFLVISVAGMMITPDAYAYVDPGSGALIWQLILAAFFGGSFYARSIIRHIKEWLAERKSSKK